MGGFRMIIHTNQMVITQDTFFLGVYYLPDGLKIESRDRTLDDNGAMLIGSDHKASGISSQYVERTPRHGRMGADTGGFLIVNRSRKDKFLKNNARLGGDGFFLSGLNPSFEPVGFADSLFEENDGSFTPNNTFEAAFSHGDTFRANYAKYSYYGFWLGFSSHGVLEDNQTIANRQAGMVVENGIDFQVRNKHFSNNHHGILLWSKNALRLEQGLPENNTSLNWTIEHNTCIANHKAIRNAADQDRGIRPLPENGELGLPAPKPAHHTVRNNNFESNINVIDQVDVQDSLIDGNELVNNLYER